MPEFSRLKATRVVSTESVLNAVLTTDSRTLRLAPDEALLIDQDGQGVLDADPHAIVISEGSFFAAWLDADQALSILQQHCEWEPPKAESWPCFCQGAVAGVPVKIHFAKDRVMLAVQSVYLHDFQERIGHGVSP